MNDNTVGVIIFTLIVALGVGSFLYFDNKKNLKQEKLDMCHREAVDYMSEISFYTNYKLVKYEELSSYVKTKIGVSKNKFSNIIYKNGVCFIFYKNSDTNFYITNLRTEEDVDHLWDLGTVTYSILKKDEEMMVWFNEFINNYQEIFLK